MDTTTTRQPAPETAAERAALIEGLVPLARKAARVGRRKWPMVEWDDLLSDAYLGIICAVDKWDPERSKSLPGWAYGQAIHAIQDGMRDRDLLSRDHRDAVKAGTVEAPRMLTLDGGEDLPIDCYVGVDEAGFTAVEDADEFQWLRARVDELPNQRYRYVLTRHLNGDSGVDIAATLGVSESRVCQLRKRAEHALRQQLAA